MSFPLTLGTCLALMLPGITAGAAATDPVTPTAAQLQSASQIESPTPIAARELSQWQEPAANLAPIANYAQSDPQGDLQSDLQNNPKSDPLIETPPFTPFSQLVDVSPTDWAVTALQSLVDRYQCLVGYPDRTFRGDRTLSRYEFAAGLNACLDRMAELIAERAEVTQDDLQAVQKLQSKFAVELANLRGRIDSIESRTAQLEASRFSATTKLSGIVNFVATGLLSGEGEDQIVLQHRPRLTFNTSFTGRDLLITRIAGGNSRVPDVAGGTQEVTQAHQWYGDFNSDFFLVTLYYMFPVNDRLTAIVTPVGGLHADYAYPPVNPYFEDFNGGTTTLSTFAQHNQIYSLGGGSGLALSYRLSDSLQLGAGYYAGQAFRPEDGAGLFDGTYSTGATLRWQANEQLAFSVSYIHGYFSEGTFGFGDNAPSFGLPAYSGTAIVNDPLSQFPVTTNAYGAEFFWQVNPKFGIGAWAGFVDADVKTIGNGQIWNYALSLVFPDLGKDGNLAALILGAQPYLASLADVRGFPNDTPFHLEAFYKHQFTDHIALTPGLIWHPAPNQNQDQASILTGTLRLTFTF